MSVLAKFGAALRRLRNEREVSQEELAHRADISVVYLRGLEGGRFNPTLKVLFNLGVALEVHPADLLREIPIDAVTWGEKRQRPGPDEGTPRSPKKAT